MLTIINSTNITQHQMRLYNKPNVAVNNSQKTTQTKKYSRIYPVAFHGHILKPQINSLNSTSIKRVHLEENVKKILDKTYSTYQQSLEETSTETISNIIKHIETQGIPKKKILITMQQATQFANIKSIENIIKELNKNNIGKIGDYSGNTKADLLTKNFGLNGSLHYLLERKKMADLSGMNTAIFLDSNKIAQIKEELKTNPNAVKDLLKDKKIKFFILSNFENGINFLTRNKNLEEVTKSLISETNPDINIINEAKALNINPIIIKNKNTPTLKNIHKQLQQEQMTKEELNAVVDAALIHHLKNSELQSETKSDIIKYLQKNLLVISPTSMAKGLEKIHNQILTFNKSLGKSPNQILYCIPAAQKSYDLINYQYQLINNVDRNKFITLDYAMENLNTEKLKNKTIVFLDDCSMSGNSMRDNFYRFAEKMSTVESQNLNFIFAPFAITENGVEKIKNCIQTKRNNKDILLFCKKINKNWQEDIKKPNILSKILGDPVFLSEDPTFDKPCVIFPYMSPDNNCNFASNIALLHDINHNECKTNDYMLRIKSASMTTFSISKLSKELLEECNNAIY